jgi:cytochrome P450
LSQAQTIPLPQKASRVPPGPKGLPVIGVGLQFARDPVMMLSHVAREYGDIVTLPLGFRTPRVFINHPDWITQVLVVQHTKFHKSDVTKQLLHRMLGQGLLTSEDDFWRRQRRLAQPAFRRSRINEYAPTMVDIATEHVREWQGHGEERDMAEEMMALTLEVAVRALFGTGLPGTARQVGQATTFLMRYQLRRFRSIFKIPQSFPTPNNRRARREQEVLDSLVYRIIAERKAQGNVHERDDVLSLLIAAMDEDGSQMTLQQLRDETMTLFLAGHETTALTLAWTWLLLSENPASEARLHEELHGVLAGRAPEPADLERLPYLQAVVNESLRLYPPAALMSRQSTAPFSLGGYDFQEGTTALMSQWVMHRDARFFDDPQAFRPERWLDGLENRLPKGAYFPFGDGPRRCIGQGFALLDTYLVLGVLAQRFKFRLVPGHPVVPEQLITLRPRFGLRMKVQARA